MNKKLWGGRFTQNTNPNVDSFNASITFDQLLAEDDIKGSIAHAKMLAKCKIITSDESTLIEDGLKTILKNIQAGEFDYTLSDEDIHMNIERKLTELIGPVGKKLHTARSRNDQVSLDCHLYLRRQMLVIFELLINLQNTLIKLAKAHTKTMLPGYTHLQRAQPILLSHHLLAYAAMFERDLNRLFDLWPRVNTSPLGAAALAGTTYPIDREYVAKLLGFDSIYVNSMDAVSDRDYIIEFLSTASMIMMHISRLSEELILWSSQEFNFIAFSDEFSTGSSIMPQKKNPDVAELARGKTARVYGSLLTLLTLMKSLPLAYNKDLQEDKEPLFDTIHTLVSTLQVLNPMLDSMKVNTEIMQAAIKNGYLNATDLADYLVTKGIAFRDAHEIVGKLVQYCQANNLVLEDLSIDILKQHANQIENDVYQGVAHETCIEKRNSAGGTSSASVLAQIKIFETNILNHQKWLLEKKNCRVD
ncbi:MAG: argininosuccinate lyase [Gammaproteobacteria bacterium]